jgi:hypothetical protein
VNTAARSSFPLLVFALVALPLPIVLRFDHGHYATSIVLMVVLCGLSLWSRTGGILATLGYLILLGDYRRYAGFFQGYPYSDPLLLVGPVAAFFLSALVFMDGRPGRTTTLSALVAFLSLLMAAEIFNPEQGGISVGLAGALFYLIPMLWFWIGRAYGNSAVTQRVLLGLIVPLAVCAALLGTYQAFFGVLPFEAAWAQQVDFSALIVSEGVRPLGFFTSPAEYVRFLLIGSTIVLAFWLRGRSWLIVLLPLLLAALFLGSTRTAVVMFVATAVILWALQGRSSLTWLPRAVVATVIGAGVLGAALLGLRDAHFASRIDALVSHNVEGLLDPTNTEKSTAVGHLALVSEALLKGVTSPAGQGLGATTLAAAKYGAGAYSAEVDVANTFYSLGVLGGLLYVAVIVAAFSSALSLWKERRAALQLAMLGVLLCTLSAWLIGGEYATVAVVWFVLGSVDRGTLDLAAEKAARRKKLRLQGGLADQQAGQPRGALTPRSAHL